MTATEPILRVEGLVKHFPARAGVLGSRTHVHAVCGVSFDVGKGETLGIVGDSGCGKSTTARVLLRLQPATAGAIHFHDTDLLRARPRALRALRRRIQLVSQNPYATLDPQMSVGAIIAEPLRIHRRYGKGGKDRVRELMTMVELNPDDAVRYPHQFSGGQRQRVGIARALALEPELVVLDEPISSLDVSLQAGIINLLGELQERLAVAYVFIAHDLSVIRHLSHKVVVMYLGKLVETGSRDDVFGRPSHPYTQALLSAVPSSNPLIERTRKRIVLPGEVPSPLDPPSGCRFRTRCWKAQEICAAEEPALIDRGQGHPVACHFAESSPPEP
ncbi:MAG: ABC transporter ATP-binding protein [Acidimicrobiales bacterium]